MQPLKYVRYQRALQAKAVELERTLQNRDDITIERTPDPLDEVESILERNLAISDLDRSSRLLQQIQLALERIDDGSFGICQSCNKTIHADRLDAVPWAAFCVHCQEAADEEGASLIQTEPAPPPRAT